MTRRQRERRLQRMAAAKLGAETCDAADAAVSAEPARPSRYGLKGVLELKREGVTEAYLYVRVSGNKSLRAQARGARTFLLRHGIKVRGRTFCERKTGKRLDAETRPELYAALRAAGRRGIPLVAVGTTRFVRNPDYDHQWNPHATPTAAELETLRDLAARFGVELGTLNDPDATPKEDEDFLRDRAGDAKLQPIGRPKKKTPGHTIRRREKWLAEAIRMRASGMQYPDIATAIFTIGGERVTPRTLGNWWAKRRAEIFQEADP